MTEDAEFTKLIGSRMRNRRFYVELNGKKNRLRYHKNGLPKECSLIRAIQCLYKRPAYAQ